MALWYPKTQGGHYIRINIKAFELDELALFMIKTCSWSLLLSPTLWTGGKRPWTGWRWVPGALILAPLPASSHPHHSPHMPISPSLKDQPGAASLEHPKGDSPPPQHPGAHSLPSCLCDAEGFRLQGAEKLTTDALSVFSF